MNIRDLEAALKASGVEIFRVDEDAGCVHVAERIRHHLMDADIVVTHVADGFAVRVVFRGQRSDFPDATADEVFTKIRAVTAGMHAWTEEEHRVTRVADPSNPETTLDVWYEIIFRADCGSLDLAIDSARQALAQERQIS